MMDTRVFKDMPICDPEELETAKLHGSKFTQMGCGYIITAYTLYAKRKAKWLIKQLTLAPNNSEADPKPK